MSAADCAGAAAQRADRVRLFLCDGLRGRIRAHLAARLLTGGGGGGARGSHRPVPLLARLFARRDDHGQWSLGHTGRQAKGVYHYCEKPR